MATVNDKLDELQVETEKLLALLKDRQVGVSAWSLLLHMRAKALQHLLDEALGPANEQKGVNHGM